MQYRYRGFDQSGGRVSGFIDAESADEALDKLRLASIAPTHVDLASQGPDWRQALGLPEPAVGLAELEFLTSELSLLLESGVRIDKAVGILQRVGAKRAVSALLKSLWNDLKQGKQLSEAMSAHPEVFDPLYVNLVGLGEASGKLPEVFRGLADELRFQRELRQKIVSASVYPAVVAGVCILAVVFIFNFVVPNLQILFADDGELPWYTAALLGSSEFLRQWQGVLIASALFGGYFLWSRRKSPAVVAFKERLFAETPGLRDATSMVERIRFCSGLGLMLDAGLPVDRALTLATGNIRHGLFRREVAAAVEKVKRGEQLSAVLRQTRIFPDYFASLLEVGEESGELSRIFNEIARRTREDFSAWALRLTTLLEPLLILIMGLIVGGVVVVMMLSITSVADLDF